MKTRVDDELPAPLLGKLAAIAWVVCVGCAVGGLMLACLPEEDHVAVFGDSIAVWGSEVETVNNVAVGGTFTHDWMPGGSQHGKIKSACPAKWAVVGIGSNDACWPFGCGHPASGMTPENHELRVRAVIDGIYAAGCEEVMLVIPPESNAAREPHVAQYREIQRYLCRDEKLAWCGPDQEDLLDWPEDFDQDPSLVHPNPEAARMIEGRIFARITYAEGSADLSGRP